MKHKAKSFIAVLLALCLMMSLGVGALADDEFDGFDTPGGEAIDPDIDIHSGDNPGGVEGSNPSEPEGPFTITVNVTGGTADVSMSSLAEEVTTEDGKTTAKANTWVFLTVKPEGDYTVSVSSDDCSISTFEDAKNQYGFLMPYKNVTISVNLTSNDDPEGEGDTTTDYSITPMVIPYNWGTVDLTKPSAKQGEVVTFTVRPANGYELAKVEPSNPLSAEDIKIDSTKDPIECSFNMPAADVTISVIFREIKGDPGETTGEHSITANVTPSEGGTVELSQTTAAAGTEVTFTVKPNPGYEMDGNLSISGLSGTIDNHGDGSYTFTMEGEDVTISVAFKQVAYAINVTTPDHGKVSTEPTAMAAAGDSVTITATPAQGYEFGTLTVTANGSPVDTTSAGDNKHTFTMPASDVTVTATFKEKDTKPEPPVKEYDVVVHEVSGGFVIANPTKAAAGTTIKLTAGSDFRHYLIGYRVITESGTKLNVTNDSFVMPNENVYVTGVFGTYQEPADWHSIDVSCPYYCDVDVASWAYENDTVTFTVDPWYYYDYYSVGVWTDGGVKLSVKALGNDKYSFTMPDDDVTIYVDYDYVGTYSITKDVEGDGSIYVRSSADHGDTVWIEAAPSAGQSLTSLRVFYGEPWAYGDKGYYGYWDEAEVKYSTYWDAYYFTMPADDVVVYARFTDGATVDVITGDHGDAKVSSRYADKGDWVYITAYPDEGYEVDSVTVTDSLGRSVKVTELSYDYFLFTMPGTNVDVKVTFRAKDYDVFYDVSRGDWYYKAVRFVHEKGIMEGTGTHYFSPEADLSRGMLATILYRLEGSPAVSGYSGFSDVADTAYYAKAVAWAKANGIVNGVTATAYEPDTAVTREELAAILCRYAAFKGKDTAISYDYLAGFSDANTSHVYARPALNWAVAYDIINGQGNGVLAPRATATRAEVAQVLMNYLEVFD